MPNKPLSLLAFDTATLSNFAIVGRLDLIQDLYKQRAAVTSEVLAEVAAGIAAGRKSLKHIVSLVDQGCFACWQLTPNERKNYIRLRRILGSGESSIIAAAQTRNAIICTDDRAARQICVECELRVTGTIGILIALCRSKIIAANEADKILNGMIRSGYYSPVQGISELL